MTNGATRTILVGVDYSPEARAAAYYAGRLAESTPGAKLLLAHAYEAPIGPLDVAGAGLSGQLETKADNLVASLAEELRQLCSVPISTVVAAAKPEPFLAGLAETASSVVVGQDTARLLDRLTYGSVAAYLASTAPCPVVVVPAGWAPPTFGKHPVVALSGDHPAPATLAAAIAEAKQADTSVLALHLVPHATTADDLEQHRHDLAAAVAAAQQSEPTVTVETLVLRGDPEAHLLRLSLSATAAVVGRPHRRGVTGWMRSVAHAVVKHTHCPLIIVPAS